MPEETAYTLGVLRWESEQQVAALLAQAFVEDPLVMAISPGPAADRLRRMRWSFRVAIRGQCLSVQPAWTIDDPGGLPLGIVLLTRAGAAIEPATDLLFALRALPHIGARTAMRGLRAAHIIASHAPPQPFTYLRTLGVHPDLHGRGLGSRLVEHAIAAAPAALPMYLETAKERNLSFYARHGFQGWGEFACLGVRVWRLLRPATERLGSRPE